MHNLSQLGPRILSVDGKGKEEQCWVIYQLSEKNFYLICTTRLHYATRCSSNQKKSCCFCNSVSSSQSLAPLDWLSVNTTPPTSRSLLNLSQRPRFLS